MPVVALLVGLAVLVGLLVALAFAVRDRSEAAAWSLLGLSALWFSADHRLEGPVLFAYSSTHGLTLADLLSGVGAAVALGVLLPRAWRAAPAGERVWNVLAVVGFGWTVLVLGVLLAVGLT